MAEINVQGVRRRRFLGDGGLDRRARSAESPSTTKAPLTIVVLFRKLALIEKRFVEFTENLISRALSPRPPEGGRAGEGR